MENGSHPDKTQAIGVFDSGLGGLTVVRELFKTLPRERIVYLGDTARVPYGNKSKETVLRFSTENVLFLLHHRVKMVIVACHTASSFGLPFLSRHFKHPVLGVVEPGVETAVKATRSGRIGVIGTNSTIGSGAYLHAIRRLQPSIKVFQAACPLFVPLVEEGLVDDPLTRQAAVRYLKPLKEARVDTLILGCTHYPLLKKVIGQVMGPRVRLVDSAHQVALKARQILLQLGLENGKTAGRSHRFYVTDEPALFGRLSRRFLGSRVGHVEKV
ncbi:MAG: glutamate racemase [Candidatus Omnitrophica bacterium]|nr:glutamate racemase [Candidatus Omnitrophota bacterium]